MRTPDMMGSHLDVKLYTREAGHCVDAMSCFLFFVTDILRVLQSFDFNREFHIALLSGNPL